MDLQVNNALSLAERVVTELRKQNLWITAVESCTGGGLAYYITNIPGASDVIKDSFITYSTEAKIALGVSADIIGTHTVYSSETAKDMANVGLKKSLKADICVAITGSISRADPNNPNSVPGEIYIWLQYGTYSCSKQLNIIAGTRIEAKQQIIEAALSLILESIQR